MKIQRSMDVNAPATDAWALLADGFGDIGEWTSVVDSSRLVGDRVEVGAVRHCRVSGPGSGDGLAVERITAFEPDSMTYTYEAVDGLPGLVRSARGTLSIAPLAGDRCRVRADGRIVLPWWLSPLSPVVSLTMGSAIRKFFRDLQYRLEHGAPHPEVAAARRLQR